MSDKATHPTPRPKPPDRGPGRHGPLRIRSITLDPRPRTAAQQAALARLGRRLLAPPDRDPKRS
jgi:hypothetical protein